MLGVRVLYGLHAFFDGTATEATGQGFFIVSAEVLKSLGADPDWNLTLSRSVQNTGNAIGASFETLAKLYVQALGIEIPTMMALSWREGSRATVTGYIDVKYLYYDAILPPVSYEE